MPLNCYSVTPQRFDSGQLIQEAGDAGSAWRVAHGVVRFDTINSGGEPSYAGLAMEGDIVGADTLLFGQCSFRATALTPSELVPWPGAAQTERDSLLTALMLGERRSARVVALRSGQAVERIRRLLGVFLPQAAPAVFRTELPPLRDMAEITSLTIETVSRTLTGLRRQGVIEPDRERRGTGRKSCRIMTDLLGAT
jgi:CRP/FNR family nitrogen fixation transcriptional regulator